MRILKLCLRIVGTNLKGRMEYRYSFAMMYVVQVFSRTFEFLTIWILLDRFQQIQGWSYLEVMLLYTLNLFSWGLAGGLIANPMRRLEGMIRDGTFDSLLTYPLNPLLHVIARTISPIFGGHLVLGAILFAICFNRLGVTWTALKFLWFLLVLVGAALIQASIMMIAGTTAFWFVKSRALVLAAIYGVRNFINYPITIYDRWVQAVLTVVLPYAFVSFYPAQYFLGKAGESVFHPALQYGTPIVGIVLFSLAYWFWKVGIDHYQSTGS